MQVHRLFEVFSHLLVRQLNTSLKLRAVLLGALGIVTATACTRSRTSTRGSSGRRVLLAHQIEKSDVLPHVRNSYLTLVISPRSHPTFKCSFFNIGCIGRHVISSQSAHVTMTSKTFKFKMADAAIVAFF